MIRFSLHCEKGHGFEAWFSKSADYEEQAARGLVSCPECGSPEVEKALMAPAVAHGGPKEEGRRKLAMDVEQAERIKAIKEMVAAVRANSEDVGDRFAEEARRIHYGESEKRGIIGSADHDDARALLDEGIAFAPLPHFPDDAN
jgi:hypothetical protein